MKREHREADRFVRDEGNEGDDTRRRRGTTTRRARSRRILTEGSARELLDEGPVGGSIGAEPW
jgi:hypothetical protein